ncbi:hypothetical protein [uncultured Ruthenibacterium sp.]|uniref:hypothetical protein n=1 Tax=uncultured Ruthenibacterium sp. TaxID=1905347 RepID=UPI00349EAC3A
METGYKYRFDAPYSLHDGRVRALERTDRDLWLRFENGYLLLTQPVRQVDGDVCVKQVEWEFSWAFFLSKSGRMGPFRGKKMKLTKFLKKYGSCPFEIVDECFGYDQVQYTGYLSLPGGPLFEVLLCVWHKGPITYCTRS